MFDLQFLGSAITYDAGYLPNTNLGDRYPCALPGLVEKCSMATVFFITHPDVAIDASMPVPDWPLNARGRARMRAMVSLPWLRGVLSVFSSDERKARDGAEILAEGLGLNEYSVVTGLGENDRSATGFLEKEEFEATVDAFFEQPQTSVRGWETATDAQARIVRAVEQIMSQALCNADIAIVGHGGTGTLLYCHFAGVPICRCFDQPPTNGGNWFGISRASRKLLHSGWHSIDVK
jgi:broad specificity phosphatase PhoE